VEFNFNGLWGVDVAIKKLRPGAKFDLHGDQITSWRDMENRIPPTREEIYIQMEKDKALALSETKLY
jgi:hypothetical protein